MVSVTSAVIGMASRMAAAQGGFLALSGGGLRSCSSFTLSRPCADPIPTVRSTHLPCHPPASVSHLINYIAWSHGMSGAIAWQL